jgi:hypothetical protein
MSESVQFRSGQRWRRTRDARNPDRNFFLQILCNDFSVQESPGAIIISSGNASNIVNSLVYTVKGAGVIGAVDHSTYRD